MADQTPWLKRVGSFWLVVGGAALVWVVLTLVLGGVATANAEALESLQSLMMARWLTWPWAQLIIACCALFFMASGWGLLRRQRWTQTLMVPAHLVFVVYALAIWVAGLMVHSHLYEGWGWLSLALLASIVLNGGMALWLNSVGASEALSWLPLRTAPLIPLKCEFCGTPLDPQTGRCPQCEADLQATYTGPLKPPDAMLVGQSDGCEFYIQADHSVTVGRGSSRNEINLSNPTVSRRHARISFDKGRYLITALEDRNGTFVNNARVRQQTLHDGDEVRFGRASYGFRIVEQP